jgi:hypothetical protein
MIFAETPFSKVVPTFAFEVDRGGVQKYQVEAAEKASVVSKHRLLNGILGTPGRKGRCLALVFNFLAEKGHRSIEMVKRKVTNPIDSEVPAPSVAESVRSGHEKPVQNGEKNRSFHVEEKESLSEQRFKSFPDAQAIPEPFEDQRRADLYSLDANLGLTRENKQHFFGKTGKGAHQVLDLPLFLEPIQPAYRANHPLDHFAADLSVFNDLQVLIVSGFLYSGKHGEPPKKKTLPMYG